MSNIISHPFISCQFCALFRTSEKKSFNLAHDYKYQTFDHRSNSFLQPKSTACISNTWLRASATYIRRENAKICNSF